LNIIIEKGLVKLTVFESPGEMVKVLVLLW